MNQKERKLQILRGNGSPLKAVKPGRNDLCKCGSGKKSKKCCGTETKYYNQS